MNHYMKKVDTRIALVKMSDPEEFTVFSNQCYNFFMKSLSGIKLMLFMGDQRKPYIASFLKSQLNTYTQEKLKASSPIVHHQRKQVISFTFNINLI